MYVIYNIVTFLSIIYLSNEKMTCFATISCRDLCWKVFFYTRSHKNNCINDKYNFLHGEYVVLNKSIFKSKYKWFLVKLLVFQALLINFLQMSTFIFCFGLYTVCKKLRRCTIDKLWNFIDQQNQSSFHSFQH